MSPTCKVSFWRVDRNLSMLPNCWRHVTEILRTAEWKLFQPFQHFFLTTRSDGSRSSLAGAPPPTIREYRKLTIKTLHIVTRHFNAGSSLLYQQLNLSVYDSRNLGFLWMCWLRQNVMNEDKIHNFMTCFRLVESYKWTEANKRVKVRSCEGEQ